MVMNNPITPIARIVFDESHSESWSILREKAELMQPDNPSNSSYNKASNLLLSEGFLLDVISKKDEFVEKLNTADILVILHPCEGHWERTTNQASPLFSDQEIELIDNFVMNGGGLFVVTEHENDKYGNNLNKLLDRFRITVLNKTISEPNNCYKENPTWIFGRNTNISPISQSVEKACFYRSGSCISRGVNSQVIFSTNSRDIDSEGIIISSKYSDGRVVVCCDSDLFGDEYFDDFSHALLWKNIFFWLIEDKNTDLITKNDYIVQFHQEWLSIKENINELRKLQDKEGRVVANIERAIKLTKNIEKAVECLKLLLPHNSNYYSALLRDIVNWRKLNFPKPDFRESIMAWTPEKYRNDKTPHIIIFPMYLPNATVEYRFEAALLHISWPDWMEDFENNYSNNPAYLPGILDDYSDGYESECAVLFPEMVSVSEAATNHFGIIFCNREAKRFRQSLLLSAFVLKLDLTPDIFFYLNSPKLCTYSFMLWDIVHDRIHTEGHLPFDPFLVRQRMPFWMYGLEELRVDTFSYLEFMKLESKTSFFRFVKYTILFDRLFRFPISGERKRNYDSLSGQILFGFLYNHNVLHWKDMKLYIDWEKLDEHMKILSTKLNALYNSGVNTNKTNYWIEAYNFVSKYVTPNVISKFNKYIKDKDIEISDYKVLLDLVHDDEFPLNLFYTHLCKLHENYKSK